MEQQNGTNYVQAAVKAAGGLSAVGRKFGINRASVKAWVDAGRVPEARAPELADMASTGGLDITCEHLCPDFPWRHACRQLQAYTRRHADQVGQVALQLEAA